MDGGREFKDEGRNIIGACGFGVAESIQYVVTVIKGYIREGAVWHIRFIR